MQNLTLNIAQYQTFNVQYCNHLPYSHYLDDNKLKILIQYLYLFVSYAWDENYIKNGIINFAPLKCRTLVQIFKIPKSTKKWLSMRPPPLFFTWNFFYQNDSEWPKIDFKHNFKKCNILSGGGGGDPHFLPLSFFSSLFISNQLHLWFSPPPPPPG